jgi:hypothetical protein
MRKRFGIDMMLECCCRDWGVVCEEEAFGVIKRSLAGFAGAKKADMVFAADKMGVELPKLPAHGREDAADAVGIWLVAIQHYARQHLAHWDQVLYSARGALL